MLPHQHSVVTIRPGLSNEQAQESVGPITAAIDEAYEIGYMVKSTLQSENSKLPITAKEAFLAPEQQRRDRFHSTGGMIQHG
jgi:hypothetical protein